MNYQEQLSIDFMAKLAVKVALYRQCSAKYTADYIEHMDYLFDKAYKEIYGYFPHGC